MTNFQVPTNHELTPKLAVKSILASFRTSRSVAVWGHPGIAKSAIVLKIANMLDVALIDMRLAGYAPEDLRGLGFPVTGGGVDGVEFKIPLELPRDLDLNFVPLPIEAEEDTLVKFYNPRSPVNSYFYCKNPVIDVRPFDRTHVATIEDVFEDGVPLRDRFLLKLRDAEDRPVAGRVRVFVKGKTEAVLALEEFNSANPSVLAACYNLLHDRKMGIYRVPDGVKIVALGNLDTDQGVTFALPKPVANRLVHYYMKVVWEDWLEWAIEHKKNAKVIGYLSSASPDLIDFNPKSKDKAFATPRTWEALSDHLDANPDAEDAVVEAFAIGTVGGKGRTFMEFYRATTAIAVPLEDILSGAQIKVDFKGVGTLAFQAYTAFVLCLKLKDEQNAIKQAHPTRYKQSSEWAAWQGRADNFVKFMRASLDRQIRVSTITTAINHIGLDFAIDGDKRMPSFEDWLASSEAAAVLVDSKRGDRTIKPKRTADADV